MYNEVSGSDSEDVGAGDNSGTGKFKRRLGAYDNIEPIAGEREVDISVTFCFVEGGRGDEYGGVTAADEAVVEEEAEGAGAGSRCSDLFVCSGFLHNLFESWT